ncbi:MAG: hypothetical protein A3F95_03145 [Candidatus Nealsonbacteria bacterium RIFCSPLOWO2_12_FULL_39_31]|uniref:Uncharacterized protein n=3 Tax=Candidatus Nealsoniibacteriota TaxID=1817911 RepID=A0A1G2EM01_9BACT|nr:MAG: hypothetical protein US88_C0013G0011 [Parcubacteria group bacterium GW2011_GWA2_38_27]KKQ96993.1 MAG: hypothetical protein UT22_C0019G0011 [Parcubacteria group bacterium GW2011_GWC2_39_11]OGZ19181.1 MAG: hypothetical protein A2626_00135 [Candidatus Nealsonbacteria bacterium RIFCSPHIGHO2_01_FULL_38_55]OGZ22182.1 MAG: hypothetical protein A3C48_00385 [Candidatus Nealsonbacteria bacterium RIFCSPHIGHO2_02_FULL_38_75]OGZ22191.1 MAG: hypothetical protein A2W55_02860 [Candidatus Nealsonbacteri
MIFLNKKFLIISVCSAILVAVLAYFGVYFLYKTIENNSKELARLEKEVVLTGNKLEEEKRIKEASVILSEGQAKINGVFVDSEIPIELIQFLENIAEENNISIDISPISFKKEEGAIWMPMGFQINLAGSFSGCRAFLQKVEYGPYLLEPQNMNAQKITNREIILNKYPDFPKDGVLMNLTIKVFSR